MTRGVAVAIMPLQASLLRRTVMVAYIFCCFIWQACGFQFSPAFRKRRNHQIPAGAKVALPRDFHSRVASLSPSFPSVSATRTDRSYSSRHLQSQRYPFDVEVFRSRDSPLFRRATDSEYRLKAASNDNDDSSISNKIRSFISKLFNKLASPVVSAFARRECGLI